RCAAPKSACAWRAAIARAAISWVSKMPAKKQAKPADKRKGGGKPTGGGDPNDLRRLRTVRPKPSKGPKKSSE
ncbi:MAG: hypothetical protein LC737_02210, partial [Chloroflexi bacterium]|nr:hypothetical protein [Chloroflexota bacterium]